VDISAEAWNAISLLGVAVVGVWVEVVRRGANSGQRTAENNQDEIREMIKPVSNGFAESVRSLLTEAVQEMHDMQGAMKEVQEDMQHVKGSQVDLHRRLDNHLEDHSPKMRRRFFR
jgi:DNA anti-recombination protein RmuC